MGCSEGFELALAELGEVHGAQALIPGGGAVDEGAFLARQPVLAMIRYSLKLQTLEPGADQSAQPRPPCTH